MLSRIPHPSLVPSRVGDALVDDLAGVLAVGQQIVDGAPAPGLAAPELARPGDVSLCADPLGVEGLGDLAAGVRVQIEREYPAHDPGLLFVDHLLLVHRIQAKLWNPLKKAERDQIREKILTQGQTPQEKDTKKSAGEG